MDGFLHAIRAIASRISNNQIFDLADAAMNLPNVEVKRGEIQS
jgi:hypothetical protein